MLTNFSPLRSSWIGAISTGILLAISWPPLPFGFLLLFAFLPLLWAEQVILANALKTRTYFGGVFLAMLIWHLVSLRWLLSMSLLDGTLVAIIDSLFIATLLMIPHRLKRQGKYQLGHLAFIGFWMSLELLHSSWELSFPLLSLGNGLGMFPQLIQWYEWTGAMGGSIWILAVNIILFEGFKKRLLPKSTEKRLNPKTVSLALLIVLPILWSLVRFYTYKETGKKVEVVAIHPNVNCHHEKYQWSAAQLQARYLSCTFQKITQNTDYVLWPENAITNTEWVSGLDQFLPFQQLKDSLKNFPKAKLITGGISYELFNRKSAREALPPRVSYSPELKQAYFTYNAAFQLDREQDHIAMRSKQQLVPIEEVIPYVNYLSFLRGMFSSFGGFNFSAAQKNEHVFRAADGTQSTALICYESAFGAATAKYVQRGAQIIFVLLNEGWYRHEQGAKQFLNLSVIRAIETRRCVARSSNDGISGFVNQRGEVLQQVGAYTPTAIRQTLHLNRSLTLYVYFKDILAWVMVILGFGLGVYSFSLGRSKQKKS